MAAVARARRGPRLGAGPVRGRRQSACVPIDPPRAAAHRRSAPVASFQSGRIELGRRAGTARRPPKQLDRNVIIGSWNLREFGRVTQRWTARDGDSPKRNIGDVWCIAEIVSRFDVIALQEVQNDTTALELLMDILGRDWGLLVTDVAAGDAGGSERLAFVFDLRRVRLTGPGRRGRPVARGPDRPHRRPGPPVRPDALPRELHLGARGPSRWRPSTPSSATRPTERTNEAAALAKLLARAMKDPTPGTPDNFRSNLIALGDFDIRATDDRDLPRARRQRPAARPRPGRPAAHDGRAARAHHGLRPDRLVHRPARGRAHARPHRLGDVRLGGAPGADRPGRPQLPHLGPLPDLARAGDRPARLSAAPGRGPPRSAGLAA